MLSWDRMGVSSGCRIWLKEKGGAKGRGQDTACKPAVPRCWRACVWCGWDLHFHGDAGMGKLGILIV